MFAAFFRPEFFNTTLNLDAELIEVIMGRIRSLSNWKFCAGMDGVGYALEYVQAALERPDIQNNLEYITSCFSSLLALKEKILSFKNSHEITKILFYSDSRYSIKTLEENADDLIFKAREIKLKLMGEENQLQVKIDFPYQLEDRLQRSI